MDGRCLNWIGDMGDYSGCVTTCGDYSQTQGYPYVCKSNICYMEFSSSIPHVSYSCPYGGDLFSTTCKNATYAASLQYLCSINSTYYNTNSAATSACTNYCATGTYYNGKCYSLS